MIAPTLLVGLGGVGSDIVGRVYGKVSDEQRKSISFVVMDTDINEQRILKQKHPSIYTIQTSTNETVGQYLDENPIAKEKWFPKKNVMLGKVLSEGAGQVRAISRLAFEAAMRSGKLEPLERAIRDLFKIERGKSDQAVRIIIVSSLCGGTGSGLILPVGLYIQNYLQEKMQKNGNVTRGFFLLPEIFDHVIPRKGEQENLRANAYAALRELDAFMMKAEKTLPEKYKESVVMDFPKAGGGYEDYDVLPYDFCFLFDAQNVKGDGLNSFEQYKEHAANCIYAQSIGPMNSRSNSSEDNVIRELCRESGRNRYAGAGTSMLIYPFEDIKKMLALNWAKECVSDKWLHYDRLYNEKKKEIQERNYSGIRMEIPDKRDEYMLSVEDTAQNGDRFSKEIVASCAIYESDGTTVLSTKWERYIEKLEKYIEGRIGKNSRKLEEQKAIIDGFLPGMTDRENRAWEDIRPAYLNVERYRGLLFKNIEDTSASTAYTLFKTPGSDSIDMSQEHILEAYLIDSSVNEFMHPNAVRYFLCHVLDIFKSKGIELDGKQEQLEKSMNGFLRQWFTNSDDNESAVPLDTLILQRKDGLIRQTVEQREFIDNLQQYLSDIVNVANVKFKKVIYSEGASYVSSLLDAYEAMFNSFEGKISNLNNQIYALTKKYGNTKGLTTRYVCASPEYLTNLLEEVPYTGTGLKIDSNLAKNMYLKIREYILERVTRGNEKFFANLFEEDIIGYFKKKLMEEKGDKIDIDIYTAMEVEARFERKEDCDDTVINQYIKDTIEETRKLSAPFIQNPKGKERDSIYSCAVNEEHLSAEDDSERSNVIRSFLLDKGGVKDPDISKYMVMFYQSIYGLRANDLSKVMPSKGTESQKVDGEYYKAYHSRIQQIHPIADKSKEINPHADKWWHLVSKMPDLDEENQVKIESNIYAAAFWGLVVKLFDLYDDEYGKKVYKIRVDELKNIDDPNLIVSTGSSCDRLAEIIDALSIYPQLVNDITDRVNEIIADDIEARVEYSQSTIVKAIFAFSLKEFSAVGTPKNYSVFELPRLIKASSLPGTYFEEDSLELLKTILSELYNFTEKIAEKSDFRKTIKELIVNQFELFLSNLEDVSKSDDSVYRGTLFDRVCSIVVAYLDGLGFKKEAKEYKEKRDEIIAKLN